MAIMKITAIILLCVTLHMVSSAKAPKFPGFKRPGNFDAQVKTLLDQMAKANKYIKFHKCHVIPWNFIVKMVYDFERTTLSPGDMNTFIDHLAGIQINASYYQALSSKVRQSLKTLTATYKLNALNEASANNTKNLAKLLYNMPSNLYPGDYKNNMSIGDGIDPPKNADAYGKRTTDATQLAKELFNYYGNFGLKAKLQSAKSKAWVKSSDKPPGDSTGDYVKIA